MSSSAKKVDESASETLQGIKQSYGKEAWGRIAVFKRHRRERVWKMMSITAGQER
jgi:hypothetical protein